MAPVHHQNRPVPVIGLEFHVQLASRTKLFSNAPSDSSLDRNPNTAVAPFDAALPGALPVLQREPIILALATSIALQCKISEYSYFERKHYFYPDSPNGFQITQRERPLATNGILSYNDKAGMSKSVDILQVQLEQDTGRSHHHSKGTLVDLNRAGTALVEIVTAPSIQSSEDTASLVCSLQSLLRNLGTSDACLESGSLRVDGNVSARMFDAASRKIIETPRIELKNIATISGLKQAIDYEINRLSRLLANGECGHCETRGWDAKRLMTYLLRPKDSNQDYRFMIETDVPFLHLSEQEIESVRQALPGSIHDRKTRLLERHAKVPTKFLRWLIDACPMNAKVQELGAIETRERYMRAINNPQDVQSFKSVTLQNMDALAYYEQMLDSVGSAHGQDTSNVHMDCFNWLSTELMGRLSKLPLDHAARDMTSPYSPWGVCPSHLASLPRAIHDGIISGKSAKMLLDLMIADPANACDAREMARAHGFTINTDSNAIEIWAQSIIKQHPCKPKMPLGKYATWVVGQVLAKSQGRVDHTLTRRIVATLLDQASP